MPLLAWVQCLASSVDRHTPSLELAAYNVEGLPGLLWMANPT
jgi:hypothetical protein